MWGTPSVAGNGLLPLVEELTPAPQPLEAFLRLVRLPYCLFLDSALFYTSLGRYSFLAADPFEFLRFPADGSDALSALERSWGQYCTTAIRGLPPFQGGAAGLFGYELNRSLERLPAAKFDEFHVPAMAVGLYDVVLAFDHVRHRAWIVSQGFPETTPALRRRRAAERLRAMRAWLSGEVDSVSLTVKQSLRWPAGDPVRLELSALSGAAPRHAITALPEVYSNFSKAGYLRAVQRAIDYIYAGDVFQVNLSQRLLSPAAADSPTLYRRLREFDSAPMAGYFDLGDFQLLSASPERFMRVRGRLVETRPIKGTRPRHSRPALDRQAAAELRTSEKDRAENVMIVDLLRNDLARVCTPESVHVKRLCAVEGFQHVWHLVSTIVGRLRDECSSVDLLRASFPGGSVTGAPKVRAMEIITELEATARGAYCGSLGYLGFDGSMDLSILIRTIVAGRGWWQLAVGGGIVAQSHPQNEYYETWHKAAGLLQAMNFARPRPRTSTVSCSRGEL